MAKSDDCCSSGNNERNGTYDLIVIGAGSAGFSAAITASEQGARVALVGFGTIGGTCVNVGCVPSKVLIRVAEGLHNTNMIGSRFAGVKGSGEIIDWETILTEKDKLVEGLRAAKYSDLLPSYDAVTYIEGKAKLIDGGVSVEGKVLKTDKVIIATGSSPSVPDINGIEEVPYLTSTTALELTKLPDSMIVLGGGYIGCELAQMFSRFGVKITIVSRRGLLPSGEPEISKTLTEVFEAEGISVLSGLTYKEIKNSGNMIELTVETGGSSKTLKADKLLLTAGRKPNTTELGLEEVGVELSGNGGVKVNENMRTNLKNVYAAGDVTGRDQFVYMAAYGAKIASLNSVKEKGMVYDSSAMPTVVFTDPQIASVGLTESDARLAKIDLSTSVLPLDYLPRALAARNTRGLIKLIADKKTDKLLGAHIIAPEGSDSIQTAALAIKHSLTVSDLAETIFPYLTTVEGLKLAAQAFDKDVKKLSCCAG